MNPPVRVLLVHHSSCLGGAERSLLEMVSAMDRKSFAPGIILPEEGPLADELFRLGVEIYFAPLVRLERTVNPARLVKHAGAAAVGVKEVVKRAREHRADVIHANSIISAPWAGPAARISGCRSILHIRDMIEVGPAGSLLFRFFDEIIAISECAARFYDLHNAHIIPSGIDFSRLDTGRDGLRTRAEAGFTRDCPVVGMVGQMVEWKNHSDFLRIAAAVASTDQSVRFIIAGGVLDEKNSPCEAKLRDMAEELGVKVHFAGWVEDMADFYAALDVLVHPPVEEPFGRTVVEAMASGVPVVAYDACGPSEIITDGRTGFLVAPGEWKSAAEKVICLLKDTALMQNTGARARRDIRSRFRAGDLAARVAALYQSE